MTTTPLAKAITTTEGVATIVLGAAVAAFSSVDPSKLPPSVAAYVTGGLTVALTLQRGLVKIVALKQLGVDPVGFVEHELLGEAQKAPVVDPTQPGA